MREPNPSASLDLHAATTDRRDVLRAAVALSAGALLGASGHARAADASALDARLLPGFKVHKVKTTGATLHTVVGGSGPPLLLIHGAPLTHLSWYRIAPELAKKYTVIVQATHVIAARMDATLKRRAIAAPPNPPTMLPATMVSPGFHATVPSTMNSTSATPLIATARIDLMPFISWISVSPVTDRNASIMMPIPPPKYPP